MTLPHSLCQSSTGTAGLGHAVVKILADRGITGDDATQVKRMFHSVEVGAIDADMSRTVRFSWRGLIKTSVFFRLMVRPKTFAASEKRLTICCRASSVWARRVQSSANSSSVMSSSMVFVRARRRRRLNTAVCSEIHVAVVWQVLFCLTEHEAEEDGEQDGGQNATPLGAFGDGETGETVRQ